MLTNISSKIFWTDFYLMVANWVSKFWADVGAGEKFGILDVPLPGVGVAGKLPPNAKAKAAPNWSCVIPGPLDPEELGCGVLKMEYILYEFCQLSESVRFWKICTSFFGWIWS